LHPDKYQAKEPAIAVKAPGVQALGEGFRAVLDDVMGEQGLRIGLGEWTHAAGAEKGAAGWGGDRYVVARRDEGVAGGAHEIAVGWVMVFDTRGDAKEMGAILEKQFGKRCVERADRGPLSWKQAGATIVVAAGPYARSKAGMKSAGSCQVAERWAGEMMKGAGKS